MEITTRQQRYERAHAELAEFVRQGGKHASKALRRIEILREADPDVHAACEQAIRDGSVERAVAMLERLKLDTAAVSAEDVASIPGSGAARRLAWTSAVVWAAVVASCWLAFPGVAWAAVLIACGWALSIAALSAGGAVAGKVYAHYSGVGEYLGALVFLVIPVTLPVGLIWAVARALRIHAGVVDGPGHDPSPGGGYARFERGDIGPAGRVIASALVILALGHTSALVGVVLRGGLLDSLR